MNRPNLPLTLPALPLFPFIICHDWQTCHDWCVFLLVHNGYKVRMKEILRKRFGTKIKELRKEKKLSQETFAEMCGFARTYISRIETGGSNVSLDAIETLANALEIPVEVLFKGL